MDRRTFLTGVIGIGTLSGCIQLTSGTSDKKQTDHTPQSPPEKPEKPEKLTEDTVTRYVAKYETAVLYNEIQKEDDYARIELDCTASVTNKTKNGYYVRARCGGAVYLQSNGHGDVYITTKYLVNNTTTRRVSTSNN